MCRFIFVSFFVIVGALTGCSQEVAWGPGVVAPHVPLQEPSGRPPWEKEGFKFEALAEFLVEGRVLAVRRYKDEAAELSPVDLALGWGAMSDEGVLEKLSIRQRNRWYTYRWEAAPPIPPSEIVRSSANMHMIPAYEDVDFQLKNIPVGSVVRLKGVLVSVQGPRGWHWRSSTSRTDTGQGACELMWVESVEVSSPND